MLDVMLTTSSNLEMIFSCYILLGSLILMIPHYIADFRMIKETYKIGDGIEVNHKQLTSLSADYQEYIRGNLLFNPLVVLMVYLVVSCIFFALPGYLFADFFETNLFIIPHFILYIVVISSSLQIEQKDRKEKCSEIAQTIFISREHRSRTESKLSEDKNLHSSKEEVHPLTIDNEKNEREGELSHVPLIPHCVSVIQTIAADDSLPLDIREDATEALRAYEAKQEQEKEQARVEDARISLDVAKKMLD